MHHNAATANGTNEIKDAVFVSRAEAAEIVRADLGDDIGELIGDSLYPTFTTHLHHQYVSNQQLGSIKGRLEEIDGVSSVFIPEVNLDVVNANPKKRCFYNRIRITLFSSFLLYF